MNRSIRSGAALAGVMGVLVLAGCGTTATAESAEDSTSTDTGTSTEQSTDTSTTDSTDTSTETSTDDGTSDYTDGTYTADGSYQTPQSVETVTVTVTLEDDIVTDVEVSGDPQASESQQYQSQFIDGIAAEVVGVDIDDLSVDRVAGSSLTSGGFNSAIEQIKQDAAA
ncbi:FMN-binding protein [Microbacterium marinilacus]|uniref:FMN-binding protein n=1 Tax=Microbacterium marinilacus TaxID=415209 RepID=A0ABP7BY38_9MICO|nr:FMN-binding protein [Microbacterium marinilacus]MBY0688108.1 FMN-binding protein [Microbacterium marinilacus]